MCGFPSFGLYTSVTQLQKSVVKRRGSNATSSTGTGALCNVGLGDPSRRLVDVSVIARVV